MVERRRRRHLLVVVLVRRLLALVGRLLRGGPDAAEELAKLEDDLIALQARLDADIARLRRGRAELP